MISPRFAGVGGDRGRNNMRKAPFAAAMLAGLILAFAMPPLDAAQAQGLGDHIRIGVLTDLSGGYEQNAGQGSVEAARMAAEDLGGKISGVPIEIIAGDHQNKPDVGVSVANRWFDVDGVDMITDLVNSAVAFAVVDVAKAKNKSVMLTSAGSADLTGKACAPDNSVHWVYDTYQMGKSMGLAVPSLGKKWFFITADYAFGHALEAALSGAIKAQGATVVGSVKAPLGTTDFSSFVLQAQASGAEVVAINNGGDDAVNAAKAAREFGLQDRGIKVVALGLDSLPAIKSAGLDVAGGGMFVSPWYPDISPQAQALTQRFVARRKVLPSSFQIGTYSAVLNWLKAVQATGSKDPKTVIAYMRTQTFKDGFTNSGTLRPDGRMVHDVFLVQIRTAADSKSDLDVLKVVTVIPGGEAFRPIDQSECPALKK
jgi:branched-chain amino acid transport system substrate-binding protein